MDLYWTLIQSLDKVNLFTSLPKAATRWVFNLYSTVRRIFPVWQLLSDGGAFNDGTISNTPGTVANHITRQACSLVGHTWASMFDAFKTVEFGSNTRGWRNEDPEPRVGGGGRPKKKL